jgi:hypothetical protein
MTEGAFMYRFLITDLKPQLAACTFSASVRAPGKTICTSENGLALVVEPGGTVRDLRPDEEADSPWCWADACGDLLVYRPDPATIVAFRMVTA